MSRGEDEGEGVQGRVDGDLNEPMSGPVAMPAWVTVMCQGSGNSPFALAIEYAAGGGRGKGKGGGRGMTVAQ